MEPSDRVTLPIRKIFTVFGSIWVIFVVLVGWDGWSYEDVLGNIFRAFPGIIILGLILLSFRSVAREKSKNLLPYILTPIFIQLGGLHLSNLIDGFSALNITPIIYFHVVALVVLIFLSVRNKMRPLKITLYSILYIILMPLTMLAYGLFFGLLLGIAAL